MNRGVNEMMIDPPILAFDAPVKWKHIKTGNVYTILKHNTFNKTSDENGVVYVDEDNNFYWRSFEDFFSKFERIP